MAVEDRTRRPARQATEAFGPLYCLEGFCNPDPGDIGTHAGQAAPVNSELD